jgi:type II secretory pathway component PulF|tara:strand:+ start:652 stop:1179 length:528 start_codon:yes stop_codon:yes gene_type:complete
MSTIYQWLTQWYEDNAKFAAVIKGESIYPLATLSVALVAAPLPELFSAQISPARYASTLLIQLFVVWGLFLRITNKLAYRQIEYFNEPWFTSILNGSEKNFGRKVYERNYLKLLWLLLSAGLDAQRSFETLSGMTRNRQWKKMHLAAIADIRKGNSLHQTLDKSGLLQQRNNQAP